MKAGPQGPGVEAIHGAQVEPKTRAIAAQLRQVGVQLGRLGPVDIHPHRQAQVVVDPVGQGRDEIEDFEFTCRRMIACRQGDGAKIPLLTQ